MPINLDIKKEYKQLLKPTKKILFFFKKPLHERSCCLHCTQKDCQHLPQVINAAAIANNQPKPYPLLPAFTFTIADVFEFKKPLTKGAYGQLFLIKHKPTGQLMVAKVFSFAEALVKGAEVLESYLQERKILLLCHHVNLIKLYYSFRSEYFMYQVSTVVWKGPLKAFFCRLWNLPVVVI